MPGQKKKAKVVLMRSTDDPICLRISIGGTQDIGFYFNFRGEPLDVALMLERVSEAFRARVATGDPFKVGDQYESIGRS
jgi:hypothetical protein